MRKIALGLLTALITHAPAHNARAHNTGSSTRNLERRYEPYAGTVGDPGCKRSVPGICWRFYKGRFAIPPCLVNAESHGLLAEHSNPWGSSGLYQIELTNWKHYRRHGWPEFPFQASLLQQSIVATDVLHAQGIRAWSTAAGCGY